MPDKKTETKVTEPIFTKEQLLTSKKYEKDRDIIAAVLEEGSYTESEIRKIIEQFKKGKVN